jgi:hypothetical protein
MSSGLTPTQDAWLSTQQMTETFSGFTAHEIATMPLDEFARLAGRQTIGQAATQAFGTEPLGRLREEPAPAQTVPQAPAPEPQGIDVTSLDMAEYAQLRGQLGIGRSQKEGVGILNQSGTQSWAEAAQRQPSRTGWEGGNVVESPRIGRVFVEPNMQPDTRPAVQRFSTPGNSYGS